MQSYRGVVDEVPEVPGLVAHWIPDLWCLRAEHGWRHIHTSFRGVGPLGHVPFGGNLDWTCKEIIVVQFQDLE